MRCCALCPSDPCPIDPTSIWSSSTSIPTSHSNQHETYIIYLPSTRYGAIDGRQDSRDTQALPAATWRFRSAPILLEASLKLNGEWLHGHPKHVGSPHKHAANVVFLLDNSDPTFANSKRRARLQARPTVHFEGPLVDDNFFTYSQAQTSKAASPHAHRGGDRHRPKALPHARRVE